MYIANVILHYRTGVYIKFEILFFSRKEIYNEVVRGAAIKNVKPFLLVNGGKNMHTFTN